jgi:hypothetical protein
MSERPTQGYTGHRPNAFQPAGQKVEGAMSAFVTDPRQTKFRRSAVEIIEPNQYKSNAAITLDTVKSADYMNRPAPAKMVVRNNNPAKTFSHAPSSEADYVNYHAQIKAFLEEDPANYEALFREMDFDGSGYLDKKELRGALLKRNVKSRYITDTLMAHLDKNSDSRVSFDEFREGLAGAKDQLLTAVPFTQVSSKAKPSWELKKQREVNVVSHEERPSVAQADFTEGGFSSHPLTHGTPQSTSHIPG